MGRKLAPNSGLRPGKVSYQRARSQTLAAPGVPDPRSEDQRSDMPDLDTQLHLEMLRSYKQENSFARRVRRAVREVVSPSRLYGLHWGDPDISGPQVFVRDRYVLPYVKPDQVALEIGPGGGRWTRYLLGFRKLYVVDYYPELLRELQGRFNKPNMQFIVNNGTDFPGVPESSVDYVISVACFV